MTPYSVAISTMNIWATNGNALNLLAVFFLNYGVVFTDVGMAWEIFSLRFLREVVNDNILPLQAFPNGSPRAPVAGRFLSGIKAVNLKTLAMSPSLPNCMATKSVLRNRT